MKKLELQKLIKEEIQNILTETSLIDIKKYGVTYNKNTKTFSVEESSLDIIHSVKTVVLFNPTTSVKMEFRYYKTDYSGSGEDREEAGWRYKSKDGKYFLLIIND